MNPEKRDRIRQTLRDLALAQASTIKLMEEALELMAEEVSLDPMTYWKSRKRQTASTAFSTSGSVDVETLSITYCGKSCFLGQTLPFRLFQRLASRPNSYVSYGDLLTDVWGAERSDAAIRSVVKALRAKLRAAGMKSLAQSIDGSVPGHYGLRLSKSDV